jgi:hypothetical protein
VTARERPKRSGGPVAGGGGSPGLHGAQRRKAGDTPGGGFRRGQVHAAHKGAAGHPDSGAGLQKKAAHIGGPAIALA